MSDITVVMMGLARTEERQGSESPHALGYPPVDIVISNGAVNIWADLPGIAAENLSVYLKGDYLVIEGVIPAVERHGLRYLRLERRHTPFYRALAVPPPCDYNGIKTRFEDGVLHITWLVASG